MTLYLTQFKGHSLKVKTTVSQIESTLQHSASSLVGRSPTPRGRALPLENYEAPILSVSYNIARPKLSVAIFTYQIYKLQHASIVA